MVGLNFNSFHFLGIESLICLLKVHPTLQALPKMLRDEFVSRRQSHGGLINHSKIDH